MAGPSRFIPASAGNIASPGPARRTHTVHPRECGEHHRSHRQQPPGCGSSPRVRGTCGVYHASGFIARFIPASAGNIHEAQRKRCQLPVHPRECGEHNLLAVPIPGQSGSSPRVRGTCGMNASFTATDRFIPASAGNITRHPVRRCRKPVHPRECGEHDVVGSSKNQTCGSSPRVRGT